MMFGLPDEKSTNSEILLRWGVKTKTNDTLRQEFVNEMVPQIQALGLSVPDPDLYYDEGTGDWVYGEIDWDEFWRVVKGDGPCNDERLGARRRAHDDGQWVREAVASYTEKARRVAEETGAVN
jgi:ring-1,2-phenylacetyl-CoA epoxidase subunit PaaA